MTRYRGPHMTSKSGGPCWTRERGYHTPAPLPAHIQRILLSPAPKPLPTEGHHTPEADADPSEENP
jgi:hypothetical protein